MPGDETRTKAHDESESEDESEVEEPIVKVDVDPSKLHPLSPEVISKQVRDYICKSRLTPVLIVHRRQLST